MSTRKQGARSTERGAGGLTTATRLRLHRRAVQVLDAIIAIEVTLDRVTETRYRMASDGERARMLDDIQAIDDLTYETEARLALCPLKAGGAR